MERKTPTPRNAYRAISIGTAIALLMGLLAVTVPTVTAQGPCIEHGYANNQVVCFFVTRAITNPSAGLLAEAEPIYVVGYLPLPVGCSVASPSTCSPEVLPSGYLPQCDPCFHGGNLNNLPYHDHVLAGAPGFGTNGTAGLMEGPWVVVVMAYAPGYSNLKSFTPFENVSALTAGELSGDLLKLNPGGSNPYEIDTGIVLIFGVQPWGG